MATFLNDTFTETADVNLDAHTGETGATWTLHGSFYITDPTLRVNASIDRCYGWFAGGNPLGVYYASGTPASADYTVTAQMYYAGSSGVRGDFGVAGRINTAAKTCYLAYWDEGVAWTLDKWVAGTLTNLGTFAATSLTPTQTYELKLQMVGTAITVYIDGVSRISVTDSAISAAGKAGVSGKLDGDGDTAQGLHFDSIVGADYVAAGTTFYFLDSTAASSNFGSIQTGGSPPSTATTATGWTVDTVGASNYALMAYGSERASSNFAGTALPNANPNNTTADCFRSSSTMSGDFATGVWTIAVPVIAVSAASGQDGRVRVRLWRSTDATGASPTEITSGAVAGTTVTDLTTGAEQVSTVTTASITGFTMTNEYLFVQIAWEITGAAT